MSLIGPRPLLPEDQPSNTALRLSVRPGITGWAQVNGAKLVSKEDKEKFDEWYVRNASPWLDTKIAITTLRILTRNYVGSAEALADLAQVQAKRSSLATHESSLSPKATASIEPAPTSPAPTSPVRAEVVKRTALGG